MKSHRLSIILFLGMIGFLAPSRSYAINSSPTSSEVSDASKPNKKNKEEIKKMDSLSMVAYSSMMAGLASFFVFPPAGLFLLPIAFITGLVAFLGGKKRYANKRGKGLAFAALVVGGGFTLVILVSLAAFALFGF